MFYTYRNISRNFGCYRCLPCYQPIGVQKVAHLTDQGFWRSASTGRNDEPSHLPAITTEDKRHEASLERRGGYCCARARRTSFGPAFGPRPRRMDRHGPRRHSSWGARPVILTFQPARRLSRSGNALVDDPRASLLRTPCVLCSVCSALLCATA